MENWVISEDPDTVRRIGEFLIQVTTIEYLLEQIYAEYISSPDQRASFSDRTLGSKLRKIFEIISSESLQHRLSSINSFRNRIAHDALEFNPVTRQVCIKSQPIHEDLNLNLHASKLLLSDIQMVLTEIKDTPRYKEMIKVSSSSLG